MHVDPVGGGEVTPLLEDELRALYERYRMAGTDIEIESPTHVALVVEMDVCVTREALRTTVERGIRRALSTRDHADGTRGLFHPDRFSFGDPVHLSRIVAAAQQVPGVHSIVVTRFGRLDLPTASGLATGTLPLGRLEIARLESDRNHPDRGRLVLRMLGGR
ncbi:MAG: hypothetical protein MUF21_11625 [Gemmatimonadaceae bacterium]|nr:hypothetical protein [Gemmatimonadaceae bacterium]